ncbi:YedE family putative selenium transporter [Desulforamulus ferrireducens]|uniref:YedE-related selenium metabolism membrane protein n=1 Tax=Desulforamulus ferrireducens TaxID=1833852 RepID=A0A1S6IZB6_9FIRM|nr:YedE family putative selenium transporter [Desulforamulus ferrireducens]AQS60115.1 YedE-related selenium metabolism membrane protein [Desulforamulus ferrireducens]
MKNKLLIVATGGIVGLLGVFLVTMGNPANMGYCIACFLRDITGALGLHRAAPVQYLRPEIIGLVLGAFFSALFSREFRVVGGSNTLARFTLAFFGIIGMLVFLGCPVRMVLRLAGGDLNALVGLAGLIVGVAIGTMFLKHGYSLGRALPQNKGAGFIFPSIAVVLLVFLLVQPAFIFFSQEGPGSLHAPVIISLAAGLLVGVLAQRSRLCMVGGIRDLIFFRDTHLLSGFVTMLIVAALGNVIIGNFNLGFEQQPIAHTDGLWNFLGMTLAGLAATLLGGCPLRQLISASEGNTDSVITVLGFVAGAAFAHNFGLAASAKGVPGAGQVAVILGLLVVAAIAVIGLQGSKAIGGKTNVTDSGRSGTIMS